MIFWPIMDKIDDFFFQRWFLMKSGDFCSWFFYLFGTKLMIFWLIMYKIHDVLTHFAQNWWFFTSYLAQNWIKSSSKPEVIMKCVNFKLFKRVEAKKTNKLNHFKITAKIQNCKKFSAKGFLGTIFHTSGFIWVNWSFSYYYEFLSCVF